MPLLNKKKFVRKKPPPDLNPNEEVFFCSATHEIFRNYEEFFERTILVNSLVWSCEVCNKSDLTYEEAQECETNAIRALQVFSKGLIRGLSCIANFTYRSSFILLVDDVFQYVKERYFIDESVDFTPPGQKKSRSGFVVGVNHPSANARIMNGDCSVGQAATAKANGSSAGAIDLTASDEEIQIVGEEKSPVQAMAVAKVSTPQTSNSAKNSPKTKELKVPESRALAYVVRDESNEGSRFLVPFANIQRRKGVLSKDRLRNFLRIVTEVKLNCGYYRVNPTMLRKKFGVAQLSWEAVFGGPVPQFVKAPLSHLQQGRLSAAAAAAADNADFFGKEKHRGRKSGSGKGDKKGKHVDEKKKKKRKDHGASLPSQEKTPQQLAEDARRKEKAAEMQREWQRLEQEMKRRESEKQARLAERERQREEKRLREVLLKEWTRCRDDLACDDLRSLPQPTRVATKLHPALFGEALTILEFFATFIDVLKMRGDLRSISSGGSRSGPPGAVITFRVLEKALLNKDPNGPLADMFFALLTALQQLQQREDKDDLEIDDSDDENIDGTPDVPTNTGVSSERLYQAMRAATRSAKYAINHFGEPLYIVQMDTMTLTEVLRLHLLSSGARVSQRLALFRWRRRGGMTPLDDPGLHFSRTDPDGMELVGRLEKTNVFDLPAADKLRLLKILVDQLLTYASARQAVDGSSERVKALRAEYRSLLLSLQRSEKNLTTLRVRRKQARKHNIEQAIAAGQTMNGNTEKSKVDEKEKENSKMSPPSKPLTMVTRNASSGKKKEKKKKLPPVPELENPLSVDPMDITEDLIERAAAVLEEQKATAAEREPEIIAELLQALSGCSGPVALGRDRAYRRYWLSRHLSGLLVESPGIDSEAERRALLVEARLCRQISSDESRFNLHRHHKTADGSVKFVTSWDIKDQVEGGHDVHNQWDQLVEDSCSGAEQWYFFPDISSLDELSASLNSRGLRESALKSTLNEFRSVLEEAIEYCPVGDLLTAANEERRPIPREEEVSEKGDEKINGEEKENDEDASSEDKEENKETEKEENKTKLVTFGVKSRSRVVPGHAGSDSASEWMELNLREALLDLEERIYAGALGAMKVTDRARWRDVLEKGGYDACCPLPLEENGEVSGKDTPKMETDVDEDSNATVEAKQEEIAERVVRDLAAALLQIAAGLHPRFIVAPLGDHDEATKEARRKAKIQAKLRRRQERERREKLKQDGRGRKGKQSLDHNIYLSSSSSEEEDDATNGLSTFERWQQGLRNTTSLSQISLYLNAFDRSILWSKSLLKARCKICRKKGDDSQLLLCDGCDRGFHMYCLKPKLTKVPKGEWFCPGCRPPEPEPEPTPKPRAKPQPRGSRSRRKLVVESEEEEEEEEEAEEEKEESEDDEETDGDGEAGSDESTEAEEESEESSEENARETDDKENEDSEEDEEGESDEEDDDDDDDEEDDDGRRRSGRVRKQTPKAMAAKVRLPLATPRTRRPMRRTVVEKSSAAASLSTRGRASLPVGLSGSAASAASGSRGRLKRGHPEGEALRDLEDLVQELMRCEESWPFMNPVRKVDVPDYHDIVKHPMDLGTMRVNFTRLGYDSPQQPMNDLWRVILNCEQYNHESSEEYQCAQSLRRKMEKRLRELGLTKLSEKAYESVRGGYAVINASRSGAPSRKRTRTN